MTVLLALLLCLPATLSTGGNNTLRGGGEQAEEVSFPTADGGTVYAHRYGSGSRGVVLAHGQVFDKESWQPLAEELAAAGHLVVAIDFRGYGRSGGGSDDGALYQDVLAAVRYLAVEHGAVVDVVGGSMGGGAAATAAAMGDPSGIRRLILLSGVPISDPERMQAESILFVASEDEPMVPRVRDQYRRAPEPKRIELLPGEAHAQHIFRTEQAGALTALIVEFLADPGGPAAAAGRVS